MIQNAILLLDVSNLAWRNYHAIGKFSYNGKDTGVIFGVLRDVILLQKRFEPVYTCFCFDMGQSKRCELFPDYKSNRRNNEKLSDSEKTARNTVHNQIKQLRIDYLPALGFQNVFGEEGYEADDIIASLCKNTIQKDQNGIIVSSDKDLYQLLRRNIIITQPQQNRMMTKQSFWQEYGVHPKIWPAIKSIMGDPGDWVPGIPGVGIKTTLKYLKDEGSWKTDKQKITAMTIECFIKDGDYKRNLKLVKLPYPKTPIYELKEDQVTRKKWKRLCSDLGMKSIRKIFPLSARR